MAGHDGTGAAGVGPMTGEGHGFCITDDAAVVGRLLSRGIGIDRGRGLGNDLCGRGWRIGRGRCYGWSR